MAKTTKKDRFARNHARKEAYAKLAGNPGKAAKRARLKAARTRPIRDRKHAPKPGVKYGDLGNGRYNPPPVLPFAE